MLYTLLFDNMVIEPDKFLYILLITSTYQHIDVWIFLVSLHYIPDLGQCLKIKNKESIL